MSTKLPPYSTFRADPKQQMMFPHAKSFGNVLTFTPPGFKQALNVKFPDSRLPVCVSCKKNFKTKDMCRVRNQHTRPPWTTAYICMTIDESCTDEDGNYVDKPLVVRMVQWRPFCVMEDFPLQSKVPVCATCKKTNRTRSFCRDRHKHRKLPWCTVYVMLSTQESADPSTVVAPPSREIKEPKDADGESTIRKTNPSESSTMGKESVAVSQIGPHLSSEKGTGEGNEKLAPSEISMEGASDQRKRSSVAGGVDINEIPESRTMLIQINDQDTIISWLKLLPEDNSSTKGVWAPQHQVPRQEQNCPPTCATIIQNPQLPKFPFPPVAPATVRVAKRTAQPTIPVSSTESLLDVYHHQAVGGSNISDGQPLPPYHAGRKGNEPLQYHPLTPLNKNAVAPPHYGGHGWAYPTAAIPPHSISHSNSYARLQQRPISPAPDIDSPGAMIRSSARSPSVTAGEAAAMRRKKPRHEFELDVNPDSQHSNLTPPPPVPNAPQLQHPIANFGQLPFSHGHPLPGPPPTHQQSQHHQHSQHHSSQMHQEQQSWMVYHQMYQPQLQPMNIQYSDSSGMTLRTPESNSRSLHHNDESPNNVTMTPGPGDGGGDHDLDDPDFNRQSLL
eukprot:CAMPEP_0168176454 /NCGR_PEP_ID=MMETSP0139_2-20121125/7796_1 /TAXON_ID=44445 /ORGANISM="Pseudo-nitzschia australis, Strain 10249 10 AB" /LENGTH=614 /DNA_ID=CAMNT_0008095173 /DNA_START=126 /DNA_END=1970 /DNA_ORIENTATION=+